MPVEDLARTEVVTVQPDTPVSKVSKVLEDEDVGSAVVVEGGGPVGIVTDRDLALRALQSERGLLDRLVEHGLEAEDVMSDDLATIAPDAGLKEAAYLMAEEAVRRLPITDAEGDLVGIVTVDDLSELLSEEQDAIADVIRKQRSPHDTAS